MKDSIVTREEDMNYIIESKIREFDKEYAKEGDIYLYSLGKLIHIGNSIEEPAKRPSLLQKIKYWFRRKML